MDPGAWLGVDVPALELDALQATLRAALMYVLGLLVIRLGSRRLLGRSTAFDTIIGVMVGALLSRAINGGAPMLPTLAATAVLVALHWLTGFLSHASDVLDRVINGVPSRLIEHNRPRHKAMWRAAVAHRDLEEAARRQAGTADLAEVEDAYLERNGSITVHRRRRPPTVLSVEVSEGVQTVRIRLE